MNKNLPIFYAILAALCYGISAPIAKMLQTQLSPTSIAAFLYLGAGLGMSVVQVARRGKSSEARLVRSDLPYTVAMVLLDIAAPILLMIGLSRTTAATASLLGNFEIVATSLIAYLIFKEAVGRRMWLAILFITVSSIVLSVENFAEIKFSSGALLVLAAAICWGVENNCTSRLSLRDPLQVVIIKGFGSGLGALLIALLSGGFKFNGPYILAALLLGFVAYGLSIYLYILAQRFIGAARTSAYYALAPFIGVGLSIIIFRTPPTASFYVALLIMIAGTYLAASENHVHLHVHEMLEHEHRHRHDDEHHDHTHAQPVEAEHSHLHVHETLAHDHPHMPDLHHSHSH